jgi:hypothetical protein
MRQGKPPWFTFCPQQTLIEGVNVLQEGLFIIDLSLVGDQTGNEALAMPTIGNRMKVLGARVTLDRPLQPTALPPVLLFHPKNGKNLVLEVVSAGPPILIQTNLVRHLIQGISLRYDVGSKRFLLLP